MFVATRVDEIFSFAVVGATGVLFVVTSVVTSMDAQTWAAPQTAHYLRGDKFEKPMGQIVQARAQVKLSGYPSGIHDRRGP
jgi:hypothetical protein